LIQVRDPLLAAERGHRRQEVRGQRAAHHVLREAHAIARIPDLLEIGRMRGVGQGMLGGAEKERIVDGERRVDEGEQQQAGQHDGRCGKPQIHSRGLTRNTN
jgi:hypothetical protein